jgi:hypothetical protein
MADSNEFELGKFFSRPIQIYNYLLTPGLSMDATISPWRLFLEQTRVANRMSNYKFMNGTLCIKVVLNGNAFMYGHILTAYTPMTGYASVMGLDDDKDLKLLHYSQRPHIFLNPTSSQGGTMCFPLIWPLNGVDITTPYFDDLGKLHFVSLQPLQHANGDTTPLSIQVWAWLEDVRLEVPTSVNMSALTPQSGEEVCDEYKGIVSKPAMAVAAVAGKLKDVPGIAPYARATEMASKAVGNIARVFGYSKPNYADNTMLYTPRYLGNLASTQGVDTCQTLAGDPKRELTIDPATFGLPSVDELDFSYLKGKETHIGSITWSESDSAGDIINEILVTPQQYKTNTVTVGETDYTKYHFATTAFMSLPFEYWRGTLKFRFLVVASNFHRGRLRIAYDPLGATTSVEDNNVNINRIIDITEEKDFTIEVGWGTEWPWLQTISPRDLPPPFGTDVISGFDDFQHNGVLVLTPVTKLTSPSSSNDSITIQVFISAGDDFEVAVPTDDKINRMSMFLPQSGDDLVPQSGDVEDENALTPEEADATESILAKSQIGSSQAVYFASLCFVSLTNKEIYAS